ncbi:MAG: energy-coupling factor transporter transmembrane component T [Leuconostoc gelidum]|jgi:energy-coupling factor transport system permease protein|uniref:Energy-coupling factor transporter transmembrane protein EcfT n=1 Tax=Leuconostoc gelidum subsp. gelidum TaxID=1607839 RepID=A0AB35FZS6_LEUGE|nr:energy-coupling factor transporter transmembrane component T [Leuconostoc gelidum]AFS41061.1 ECF transporter energy-coupling factor T [Leuconostoc gelidum JB7]MBZ5964829.1 energy-coupling factor transporter transmembrane protein EcfT [Leuconostoc gelidum subsp. gelidum]MBZ5975917.1 energy-coupling factor transporter transmembrane protein EcfT [Leuconostoc gelidum subsp. gelidum]MBZ5976846.1 energy-coupling factor transporter transmembrane protein EcfT [Leuconostoc gelidum subsp. gelidum]MBZ
MNNIMIGRFVPGNSWVHRLDPRTKMIVTFVYIIVMLWANNWQTYAWTAAFVVALVKLTDQPFKLYWDGLKPIFWLILFTVILQLLFTPGTPILFSVGPFQVTVPGILNAIYVMVRFVLIILMSTILTLTTPPTSIANALESLLSPFKKIGVPVAELALMLAIALRFVPLLMDEMQKIMNAQKSRGMSFSTGGPIKRAKAIIPLLIPLFIGALQRALDLANAMEVRGFKDAVQRTKYRILSYQKIDKVAFTALIGFVIIFFVIKTWLHG